MFKLVIVLAIFACVSVQANLVKRQAAEGGETRPEPYSYQYSTDSHEAAEQNDPNGRVTGYYTVVDADGRQRRVDYYADETGFHAKVATNEVGTKSENSADVEVQASPPTAEQLAASQAYSSSSSSYSASTGAIAAPVATGRQTTTTTIVGASPAINSRSSYSSSGYGTTGNSGYYGSTYGYAPTGVVYQPGLAYAQRGQNMGRDITGNTGYGYQTQTQAPGYVYGYQTQAPGYTIQGQAPGYGYYSSSAYRSGNIGSNIVRPATGSSSYRTVTSSTNYGTSVPSGVYQAGFSAAPVAPLVQG